MKCQQTLLFTQEISVETVSYPIYIGKYLFGDDNFWRPLFEGRQAVIVTNEVVAPLYLAALSNILHFLECDVVILPDGECNKNERSLFSIFDKMQTSHHHRDTTIVALGGGVIGDMAGMAASLYQRGVDFIQVPTTLLAQVDSSVGGKTAINYHQGKNMLGSFYQPKAVVIDLMTLMTLPPREFRAGLAEVIKYGLLVGGAFWQMLQLGINTPLNEDTFSFWGGVIHQCCQIKGRFVSVDEREQGVRALLNLGHTFAHALESITHFRYWLHGEAVAIGLYCAALLSFKLGKLSHQSLLQLDELLKLVQLPRRIPRNINLSKLIALMQQDKKVKNNQLRFILCCEWGVCYIDESINFSLLLETLQQAVEGEIQ